MHYEKLKVIITQALIKQNSVKDASIITMTRQLSEKQQNTETNTALMTEISNIKKAYHDCTESYEKLAQEVEVKQQEIVKLSSLYQGITTKLSGFQKINEDYKKQLENRGPNVRFYYDNLIKSLEEANSHLQMDLEELKAKYQKDRDMFEQAKIHFNSSI